MIRATTVIACLGLSACATITDFRESMGGVKNPFRATPTAAPQTQILTAKERLLAAIEGQGCELTATNVNAILADAVINREELLQLTPQLQSEGRIEVSGSGVRSTSAICN
ncbi:MAG: hypothetical protein ACI82I_000294 [Gammaproteobacteria bacterium]|jgi:hypothetical protein